MKAIHGSATKVAVYWDFENIHAGVVDAQYGEGAYRNNFGRTQPELVKMQPVMSYITSLGEVAINRAYANWRFLGPYKYQLLDFSIDLIQLYSRGSNAKNGADIRIVL